MEKEKIVEKSKTTEKPKATEKPKPTEKSESKSKQNQPFKHNLKHYLKGAVAMLLVVVLITAFVNVPTAWLLGTLAEDGGGDLDPVETVDDADADADTDDEDDEEEEWGGEEIITTPAPRLVANTTGIAQDTDLAIWQDIWLILENDSFNEELAPDDLHLSGGFEHIAVEDFLQDGNQLSFTLHGKADGEFGTMTIAIDGDRMASGEDIDISFNVGRLVMPYQSGPLYAGGEEPQTLSIFLDSDAFSPDINIFMLSFGGVMNDFDVTGLSTSGASIINLSLTGGPASAGTGTVTFDSAAVASGSKGLVAEITVHESEEHFEADWVVPLGLEDYSYLLKSPVGAVAPAPVTSIAKEVGVAALKGIASGGSSYATKSILDLIFGGGGGEYDVILDALDEMMNYMAGEFDALSQQADRNQTAVMARLDLIDYNTAAWAVGDRYSRAREFYDEYVRVIGDGEFSLSGPALDRWMAEYMSYPGTAGRYAAKDYILDVGYLLDVLNPYRSNKLHTDSLIVLFAGTCRSHQPFAHNVHMAVLSYVEAWDAEIAALLSFANAIYDYNFDQQSSTLGETGSAVGSLNKKCETIFTNVETYMAELPEYHSYLDLVAGYKESPKHPLLLALASSGKRYLLTNTFVASDGYRFSCFEKGDQIGFQPDWVANQTLYAYGDGNAHYDWQGISNISPSFVPHPDYFIDKDVATFSGHHALYFLLNPKMTVHGRDYQIARLPKYDKYGGDDHDDIKAFINAMLVFQSQESKAADLGNILNNYVVVYTSDLTGEEDPADYLTALYTLGGWYDYLYAGYASYGDQTSFNKKESDSDYGRFITMNGPIRSVGERAEHIFNPSKSDFSYDKHFAILMVEK